MDQKLCQVFATSLAGMGAHLGVQSGKFTADEAAVASWPAN